MKMNVSLRSLMLIAALAVLTGCATSRSEVKLGGMDTANYTVTKSKVVLIRSVTDERVFEQEPSDPSTPSLGGEGANGASADTKARAIGRKRGGFGKALGDVLLENGQTVAGVVRENLTTAFKQAGYRTTSSAAEAGPSPMIVDVHIKQFWAWVQPGFWALTLNSHITTDLEISGTAAPTVVSVSEKDSRQLVTDSAWIEIVDKTLKDYREQASAKAAGLP
ncbi:hypothetical protein [Sideroxydans lithotrophicus]|uniref:Flagellar biosynthetic protein n=1 Tax=Sideroxydans lithotrophicus (strain ES-1) TaxID=580332 RepID=D5CUI2_SIDLE|nr:hypothetical protein [Sideroxydans lithotrophicus]ADE12369.1 flagellar biosynthetic protein [Sideroxydans lithotrophicus ES-1]